MRLALAALLAVLALPATATDAPMTAAEFEAYALGKTLTYAVDGQVYGTEQYLPGRQVIWAYSGQDCRRGHWYEQAGDICFVYVDGGAAQCWRFFHDATGLSARFSEDTETTPLKEVGQSATPLLCPGPKVGV